jgi:DNA-binding transcriptional LysR family regulator
VALASLATTIPNTLSRRGLLREQLNALIPIGHPLAARGEFTLSDLATETVSRWSPDAQPRGGAWLPHPLSSTSPDNDNLWAGRGRARAFPWPG